MKKTAVLLLVSAALLLCGCGQKTQSVSVADDGYISVENLLTAKTPEGFVLSESNEALAFSGIYYFTWTSGEGENITNAAGDDAVVYDCQIYMLAALCGGQEYVQSSIAGWKELESENYDASPLQLEGAHGSVYDCLMLNPVKDDSPFAEGAALFIEGSNVAVSVEIFRTEAYEGDISALLRSFAEGIVFTEQENN